MTALEAIQQIDADAELVVAGDRVVNDAYHFLCHFLADEDIREREPNYLAMQQAALRKWAERLRAE